MKTPVLVVAVALVLLGTTGRAAAADFAVTMSGQSSYVINGQQNPPLTLKRGKTYTFEVNAPDHPFLIKTVQETGSDNTYDTGVTNNGVTQGTLTFTVPASAPSLLFYQCEYHDVMTGRITLESVPVPATTVVTRLALFAVLALLGLAVLHARRARQST